MKRFNSAEDRVKRLEEDKSKLVHIKAWTKLRKYRDGYKLKVDE